LKEKDVRALGLCIEVLYRIEGAKNIRILESPGFM
jgi:hypothetical protein